MTSNSDQSRASETAPVLARLTPQSVFWTCFAVIAAWLAAAAYLVNIDLFDGYSTIANSQYYLSGGEYFWQRGPLLAMLLIPAEFIAQQLHLHPFDVRPHHALMAMVHALYLIGIWRLLQRHFGSTIITVTAFLAAIPTFVFFSYAPFVSHDIFPGVMALLMLTLGYAFMANPSARLWLALFALGAALPLIKQTYALVWAALLFASASQLLFNRDFSRRAIMRLSGLTASALCSAALCWMIYSLQLAERFPESPFLLRPIELVRAVSMLYLNEGAPQDIFYQFVYLKNLSAYGLVAVALVLPGLMLALGKRGTLLQLIALAWLFLLLALVLIPIKEVRYLAFLAPLTAALLIPVLTLLWALRPVYRYGIYLVLLIDVFRIIPEALRIHDHYYQAGVIEFLAPISNARAEHGRIYYERYLSFISPEQYAFFGDRYHRITHLDADLLAALYQIPPARFQRLDMGGLPDLLAHASPDDVFLLASSIAARVKPFRPGNAAAIDPGYVQSISSITDVPLTRVGDHYLVTIDAEAPVILAATAGGQSTLVIGYRSSVIAANSPIIQSAMTTGGDTLQVRGLRASTLCTLAGCQNFARVDRREPAEGQ